MLADQRNETLTYPLCGLLGIRDSLVVTHSGPIVCHVFPLGFDAFETPPHHLPTPGGANQSPRAEDVPLGDTFADRGTPPLEAAGRTRSTIRGW